MASDRLAALSLCFNGGIETIHQQAKGDRRSGPEQGIEGQTPNIGHGTFCGFGEGVGGQKHPQKSGQGKQCEASHNKDHAKDQMRHRGDAFILVEGMIHRVAVKGRFAFPSLGSGL